MPTSSCAVRLMPTSKALEPTPSALLSQEHMYFIVGEHEEILARLKAHDIEGADESMGVHLISVMRELDPIRATHPEYFSREGAGGR